MDGEEGKRWRLTHGWSAAPRCPSGGPKRAAHVKTRGAIKAPDIGRAGVGSRGGFADQNTSSPVRWYTALLRALRHFYGSVQNWGTINSQRLCAIKLFIICRVAVFDATLFQVISKIMMSEALTVESSSVLFEMSWLRLICRSVFFFFLPRPLGG